MFEAFNTPAAFSALQPTLALFATGHTTGTVINVGESTSVAPIYDSYCLPHAIILSPQGGRSTSDRLLKSLVSRGYAFKTPSELQTLSYIMEKYCYVADKEEQNTCEEKSYRLPDGKYIALGKELFETTEALFTPNGGSLQEELLRSINKCDVDVHSSMFNHIVLAGGLTMLPGL